MSARSAARLPRFWVRIAHHAKSSPAHYEDVTGAHVCFQAEPGMPFALEIAATGILVVQYLPPVEPDGPHPKMRAAAVVPSSRLAVAHTFSGT